MMNHALLAQVGQEMDRQVAKWGEQNHPSSYGYDVLDSVAYPTADDAKYLCDSITTGIEEGVLSWTDIFLEEVLEAREEAVGGNLEALKEELIQCAAVALSWVESIERNGK
jgi:hypothetical protein